MEVYKHHFQYLWNTFRRGGRSHSRERRAGDDGDDDDDDDDDSMNVFSTY